MNLETKRAGYYTAARYVWAFFGSALQTAHLEGGKSEQTENGPGREVA